jgi:hypothetical protein
MLKNGGFAPFLPHFFPIFRGLPVLPGIRALTRRCHRRPQGPGTSPRSSAPWRTTAASGKIAGKIATELTPRKQIQRENRRDIKKARPFFPKRLEK